jgi:hypothetical protein
MYVGRVPQKLDSMRLNRNADHRLNRNANRTMEFSRDFSEKKNPRKFLHRSREADSGPLFDRDSYAETVDFDQLSCDTI